MNLSSLTEEFYVPKGRGYRDTIGDYWKDEYAWTGEKYDWEHLSPEELGKRIDKTMSIIIANHHPTENKIDGYQNILNMDHDSGFNYRNLRADTLEKRRGENYFSDYAHGDDNFIQALWKVAKYWVTKGRNFIARCIDKLTMWLRKMSDKGAREKGFFGRLKHYIAWILQWLTTHLHDVIQVDRGNIGWSNGNGYLEKQIYLDKDSSEFKDYYGNTIADISDPDGAFSKTYNQLYNEEYHFKMDTKDTQKKILDHIGSLSPSDYGDIIDGPMNELININTHAINTDIPDDIKYGIQNLDHDDSFDYRNLRMVSAHTTFHIGNKARSELGHMNPFQKIWYYCKTIAYTSRDAIATLLDKLTVWLRKVRDRNRTENGILSKVIAFLTNCVQFLTSRLHNFIQSGRGNIYDSEGQSKVNMFNPTSKDNLELSLMNFSNRKYRLGKISESYRPRFMPVRKTEFDYLLEEAEDEIPNFFMTDDWDSPTSHQGGSAELWDKVRNVCIDAKDRAVKSAGLGDKITIRSIINKLCNLASSIMKKAREVIKNWTPSIKNALDKICNYIMDFVDYIKTELE